MRKRHRDIPSYPTITALLKDSSVGREEKIMIAEEWSGGKRVSYGQFAKDLLRTAAKLQSIPARHIGVVCDLSYACILCMYAVMVAGKVLVPLEADLSDAQLENYIRKADVELVLFHPDRIEDTVTGCPSMEIGDFLGGPEGPSMDWPEWEGDREACIVFTSGTEGGPRGVVLTQHNMSFTNCYSQYKTPGQDAKILLFLPIHHIFSFLTVTNCIYDSTRIHLSRSVKYFARDMERVRPDVLATVPMVNELLKNKIQAGLEKSGQKEQVARLIRLSNGLRKLGIDIRTPLFRKLRERCGCIPQLLITGGAAVSESSFRFFDDIGTVILQAYGMTETPGSISTNTLEENRVGSVGHVHPYNQVRIWEGEIQVRGPNVMKGYYKDPQATAQAFQEDWFRTGDLGYFDEEGYLFITGRKKNLIILDSGENVSPEELEQLLLRSPAVAEAVVRERGGRIHADIFPDGSYSKDPEQIRQAVRQAIGQQNRQLPVYKRIVTWELRETPFEKTSSAKIRR